MIASEACSICGSTEDLVERRSYVGGQGYVWAPECRDQRACAERFSDQLQAELDATREQRRVA